MKRYLNRREKLLRDRGEAVARAYQSWTGMRRRCRHADPARAEACYENINVAKSWDDFEVFLKDLGEPPIGTSLDRIDSSKDYTAKNCRWANAETQSRNRAYVKLSVKKADWARRKYVAGWSQQKVADKLGVSQLLISLIVRGKLWKVKDSTT